MAPAPQVTVVIPSANRWEFVLRSTRCALAQQHVAVEVVVCSDGPRNPVPPTAPELRDDRVRVFQDPAPRGVCRARNLGLSVARGEFVAFLDDDDVWAPDKLRSQLDAMVAVDADFAYSSAVLLDAGLRPLRVEDAPPVDGLDAHAARMNPFPAGASNVIARTALLREIGGFDGRLQHFGDWDIANALIHRGGGARVDAPLVGYVAHEDAMHVRLLDGIEREFAYFSGKQAALGRAIDSRISCRWIASGYRQAGRRGRAARWYLRSAVESRAASDVVRAGATMLGEWAMRLGRSSTPAERPAAPEWVARLPQTLLPAA